MGYDDDEYPGPCFPPNTFGTPVDYNLDLAEGLNAEVEGESDILQFDPLSNILYTRYGVISPTNLQPGVSLTPQDIRRMGQIIGDNQTSLSESWQGLMSALINVLAPAEGTQTLPSRDLDNPTNIEVLIKQSNVMVTRLEHELGMWFLLEGREFEYAPSLWKIVVPDAASALQCLHGNWGPHDTDIIQNLCQRGIPFHTLAPLPLSLPRVPSQRPLIQPRYRRYGYKPDPITYIAYEDKQDEFLKLPHAHAALMMGGIVWQLSIRVVGAEKVLAGPCEDAWQFGSCHHARGMVASCDDTLNEDELDLICGVYKTYNNKC